MSFFTGVIGYMLGRGSSGSSRPPIKRILKLCRNCYKKMATGVFGFCDECFEIIDLYDKKWLK